MRNKKVLITGAARGIGWHLACEFLHAGASVYPVDIIRPDIEVMRSIGDVPDFRTYDVSDRSEVMYFANRIPTPDILINNAGIPCNKEMAEMRSADWERLVGVNLMGPIYHIAAYISDMVERGSGHIVNVSSGQAFFRLPTWGAYAATKVALGAISELMAFEVRKHGIKVTTVYPFMVNTPFYKGVVGETAVGRLSMNLIPFYSNKPETVARKIFAAVRDGKRVEMVNPLNLAGVAIRAFPPVADAVTWAAEKFLAKRKR